jgi:hypothetical protein
MPHAFFWDIDIWDTALWAKYSASWDNAVWDSSEWNTVWLGKLDNILAKMERYSGIQTVSDHVCEPGMDTITSPFKTAINNLEKKIT